MKKSSNKGFTLVELIIVIAILAIIMLIAIPNFSGIQQRMKVRADKSTAAQIGKAVRVWYTDYTSDPVMKKSIDDLTNEVVLTTAPVVYNTITKIEEYASKTYEPTSLAKDGVAATTQVYLVNLSSGLNDSKVVVGIATAASDVDTTNKTIGDTPATGKYGAYLDDTDDLQDIKRVQVTYNGTAPGVAYVEP